MARKAVKTANEVRKTNENGLAVSADGFIDGKGAPTCAGSEAASSRPEGAKTQET
jgi:hypothetical protein